MVELLRRCAMQVALLGAVVWAPSAAAQPSGAGIEQRAIDYLAHEVPRWSKENHCFSCHNNGDAARALYVARDLGYRVPGGALADTTAWLLAPQSWDDNKGANEFSDTKLARIQFAAALAQALETGLASAREPLAVAAETLLAEQREDGAWSVDASGALGSPATYGITLATYAVRQTLAATGERRFAGAIAKADAWFLTQRPRATVDAAALALALLARQQSAHEMMQGPSEVPSKLRETLAWIQQTQASDGGWGPYPKSPSEAFDTAIALLALAEAHEAGAGEKRVLATGITEGRVRLQRDQLAEGGWTETTRPSGNRSYAQHISTSGWATLALLRTARFETAAAR